MSSTAKSSAAYAIGDFRSPHAAPSVSCCLAPPYLTFRNPLLFKSTRFVKYRVFGVPIRNEGALSQRRSDKPLIYLHIRSVKLVMWIPPLVALPVSNITPWMSQVPYGFMCADIFVITATFRSWSNMATPHAAFDNVVTRTFVDICRLSARQGEVRGHTTT